MKIQPQPSYHDHVIRNTRLISLLLIVISMTLGLTARAHRNGTYSSLGLAFMAAYSGDTLWGLMCFFVGRLLFPKPSIFVLAMATILVTTGIEFSQIWKPYWLEELRSLPAMGFLLGKSFIWSDIFCLVVGVGLAMSIDRYVFEKIVDDNANST